MLSQTMPGSAPGTPISGRYWLFRGPSAYHPATLWRPLAGGLVSIGIFAGAVLAVGLLIVAALGATGSGFDALLKDTFIQIAATFVQQGAMIALTLLAATRFGGKAADVLALRAPAQGVKAYPVAFALLVVLSVVMTVIGQLIDSESVKVDTKLYLDMMKSEWWWLAIILVGVGAPLSEELLCRGFLFSALANSRLGTLGAAVITSLGFAIVHPYSILGVAREGFAGVPEVAPVARERGGGTGDGNEGFACGVGYTDGWLR